MTQATYTGTGHRKNSIARSADSFNESYEMNNKKYLKQLSISSTS